MNFDQFFLNLTIAEEFAIVIAGAIAVVGLLDSIYVIVNRRE